MQAFYTDIVRLYRGEKAELTVGGSEMLSETFPEKVYRDVAGLCKIATLEEIEAQRWSLNPGRYVGVAQGQEAEDIDFVARYTYLYQALTTDDFVGYLTNNATDSAYPAVNTGDFKNADVLIPRIELMGKFHNIVADIFNEKDNFIRKNNNLRQTRDLLLP